MKEALTISVEAAEQIGSQLSSLNILLTLIAITVAVLVAIQLFNTLRFLMTTQHPRKITAVATGDPSRVVVQKATTSKSHRGKSSRHHKSGLPSRASTRTTLCLANSGEVDGSSSSKTATRTPPTRTGRKRTRTPSRTPLGHSVGEAAGRTPISKSRIDRSSRKPRSAGSKVHTALSKSSRSEKSEEKRPLPPTGALPKAVHAELTAKLQAVAEKQEAQRTTEFNAMEVKTAVCAPSAIHTAIVELPEAAKKLDGAP